MEAAQSFCPGAAWQGGWTLTLTLSLTLTLTLTRWLHGKVAGGRSALPTIGAAVSFAWRGAATRRGLTRTAGVGHRHRLVPSQVVAFAPTPAAFAATPAAGAATPAAGAASAAAH